MKHATNTNGRAAVVGEKPTTATATENATVPPKKRRPSKAANPAFEALEAKVRADMERDDLERRAARLALWIQQVRAGILALYEAVHNVIEEAESDAELAELLGGTASLSAVARLLNEADCRATDQGVSVPGELIDPFKVV